MRYEDEWGGAIEIKLYCDIFVKNVLVKSIPNQREIEFISKTPTNIWNKIYWTGSHYEQVGTFIKENSDNNIPTKKTKQTKQIILHKSWYGHPNDKHLRVNVTPIIRKMLKKNNNKLETLDFKNVSNLVNDPCPKENKILVIKYYSIDNNTSNKLKTVKFNVGSNN